MTALQTTMGNVSQLNSDKTLQVPPAVESAFAQAKGWLRSRTSAPPSGARLMQVGYSFADQGLAIGGSFLARMDAVTGIGE